MLVLTRRRGEKVVIGNDTIIKIISVREGRIKLGFKGPPDIPIHRKEIWDRINLNSGLESSVKQSCTLQLNLSPRLAEYHRLMDSGDFSEASEFYITHPEIQTAHESLRLIAYMKDKLKYTKE